MSYSQKARTIYENTNIYHPVNGDAVEALLL